MSDKCFYGCRGRAGCATNITGSVGDDMHLDAVNGPHASYDTAANDGEGCTDCRGAATSIFCAWHMRPEVALRANMLSAHPCSQQLFT
eukprot:365632-Chlamydomonas_euryale.AAC.2